MAHKPLVVRVNELTIKLFFLPGDRLYSILLWQWWGVWKWWWWCRWRSSVLNNDDDDVDEDDDDSDDGSKEMAVCGRLCPRNLDKGENSIKYKGDSQDLFCIFTHYAR